MDFSDKLNNFIDIIGCTAKELSDSSSISTSVISRYRSGSRVPKFGSKQLDDLIFGLATLANKNNINNINEEFIKRDFYLILNKNSVDFDLFRTNFNLLITTLKINVSELSKYIGFDSSYLSKIRAGIRKPQNLNDFVCAVAKYVVNYYSDNNYKNMFASIFECNLIDIDSKEDYEERLIKWICNNTIKEDKSVNSFLNRLDEFDLNNYIKVIKFDDLKVPTLPINIPKSKVYYGIDGFKNSQLDALKSIVLSKSHDDVFFYSNMPIYDISKDVEFTKKYMFGLALILKKGINMNVIHNLDRPLHELMLGLEGWIPLYMTGMINPYYFKNNYNRIYSQLECIGGSVALSGTSVMGNINTSSFYLTNKSNELNYYKEKAKLLLDSADRLMDIYNKNKEEDFHKVLLQNASIICDRRNIYSSLPIYTISDSLLERILDRNKISDKDKMLIFDYVHSEKLRVKKILNKNKILDEVNILSLKEFKSNNISLSLSYLFYDKKILYNYDEYLEHIELIKKYRNKNYSYIISNNYIFKNINIHILEDKEVLISKENDPSIHFVIYHPTLIAAISKFKVMLNENDLN